MLSHWAYEEPAIRHGNHGLSFPFPFSLVGSYRVYISARILSLSKKGFRKFSSQWNHSEDKCAFHSRAEISSGSTAKCMKTTRDFYSSVSGQTNLRHERYVCSDLDTCMPCRNNKMQQVPSGLSIKNGAIVSKSTCTCSSLDCQQTSANT